MPTVVNGYCSTADVRSQLGDAGTTLDESLLVKAVNATSRAIDLWCSDGVLWGSGARRFWQGAGVVTHKYRTDDPSRIWVDDISTATGLILKTDPAGDGTFSQTWTTADYQLEPLNAGTVAGGDTGAPFAFWEIAAMGPSLWFPIFQQRAAVSVTARYGWSAIPDEVPSAAILKASSLFLRKDAPWGVAGFAEFGPVRITRADPDVIDLLKFYKKTRSRTLTYRPQAQSMFHRAGRNPTWPNW